MSSILAYVGLRPSRHLWVSLMVVGCAAGAVSAFCDDKEKVATPATAINDADQKKLDELKEEREIGRNMAGRLLAYYGAYNDPQLLGYINQVGSYVGSFNNDPDHRYMFEILNTDMINAFAAPGGYILITLGAIRNARDEAELAVILAHETVHVSKRHVYNKLRKMSKEEMDKAAKDLDKKTEASPEVAVRKRPEPEESATGALVARYLQGSSGLSLLSAAKAGMSVLMDKGLGADLEYEADREGVRLAIQAGYQPKALLGYLCRLNQLKHGNKNGNNGKCVIERVIAEGAPKTVLDKTHPPIPARADNVQKLLDQMKAEEIIGASGVSRFKQFTANLPPPKKA